MSNKFRYRPARIRPPRSALFSKTGAELEPDLSREAFSHFVTADGLLGSLLGVIPPPQWPSFVGHWAGQLGTKPSSVPLERLALDQRWELLELAAIHGPPFAESRSLPMWVAPKIEVDLRTPVTIRGNKFLPGRREIDISDYARDPIEKLSDVDCLNAVELHFVGEGSAGRNAIDAFTVAELMGLKTDAAHIHLLFELERLLTGRRPHKVPLLLDFWRRGNLVGELLRYANKIEVRPVYAGDYTVFNHLDVFVLNAVFQYLLTIESCGWQPDSDTSAKVCSVGWRSGIYNQNGFDGWEVRTLRNRPEFIALTDALHAGLHSGRFGISSKRMARYLDLSVSIKDQYYNAPTSYLLRNMSSRVSREASLKLKWMIWSQSTNNYGYKLLIYDWSKDLLLFDQPRRLSRVIDAQIEGLHALSKGQDDAEVFQRFAIDSGLIDHGGRSLNMRMDWDLAA